MLTSQFNPAEIDDYIDRLTLPARAWSKAELYADPRPLPAAPGVYAWWFRKIPPGVPTDNCVRCGDLTRLYGGISPSATSSNGKPPSRQNLRKRIGNHFGGQCVPVDAAPDVAVNSSIAAGIIPVVAARNDNINA